MTFTLPTFSPDELVGKPFVILPGNPPDHKVVSAWRGEKVRAGGVMQVWNDALLICSIEGGDAYMKGTGERNRAYLRIGETLYGILFTEMLAKWQAMPNLKQAIIWKLDGALEVLQ